MLKLPYPPCRSGFSGCSGGALGGPCGCGAGAAEGLLARAGCLSSIARGGVEPAVEQGHSHA
eukprot:12054964-Alexandrium_andersonii.AAC.1